MIELAPQNKLGLSLANPVMIAAGCAGYGPPYQDLVDLAAFGAIVTNPISLRPRRGAAQPRLVETPAGFVLNTGGQNPGIKKVLRQYGPAWRRLGTPVIAHLPADEPADLQRVARALGEAESTLVGGAVVAIELGLPPDARPGELSRWIEAVREGCLLPLLVRLPLELAGIMAEAAEAAGADALVVGAPPPGAAVDPASGVLVRGDSYGPGGASLALYQLQLIRSLVEIPLVGAGGIHSAAAARAFLQTGAAAVQLDSLLFFDPQAAGRIARTLPVEA